MELCVIPTERFTVLGIKDTRNGTIVRRQDSAINNNSKNHSNNNSNNNAVNDTTSSTNDDTNNNNEPIIRLDDFILHDKRNITSAIQNKLISSLKNHGYILLSTSCTSRPGKVIQSLRQSLDTDLFPPYISTTTTTTTTTTSTNYSIDSIDKVAVPQETTSCKISVANVNKLKTSRDEIYVSEKGIPMYKLGYELCEDNVREVFRIAAGDPDTANIWPDDDHGTSTSTNTIDNINNNNRSIRKVWLQGLGLMRHITDIALDLVLSSVPSSTSNVNGTTNSEIQSSVRDNDTSLQQQQQRRQYRPYSTVDSWIKNPSNNRLQERRGDFSVLYAMHYFNSTTYTTTTSTSINNDGKHVIQTATININNKHNNDENSVTSRGKISSMLQLLEQKLPQDGVAVKEHVDPSLFVCEPFLCPYSRGLQVWNRFHCQQQQQQQQDFKITTSNGSAVAANDDNNNWIDCDGHDSPIIRKYLHNNFNNDNDKQQQRAEEPNEVLLLFVGKAIQSIRNDIEPTKHRVVVGSQPRRCVIYEQKYAEFFPVPTF